MLYTKIILSFQASELLEKEKTEEVSLDNTNLSEEDKVKNNDQASIASFTFFGELEVCILTTVVGI